VATLQACDRVRADFGRSQQGLSAFVPFPDHRQHLPMAPGIELRHSRVENDRPDPLVVVADDRDYLQRSIVPEDIPRLRLNNVEAKGFVTKVVGFSMRIPARSASFRCPKTRFRGNVWESGTQNRVPKNV
jgi:hypothetical protein